MVNHGQLTVNVTPRLSTDVEKRKVLTVINMFIKLNYFVFISVDKQPLWICTSKG